MTSAGEGWAMSTRRMVIHDEECEAGLYEGGVCICVAVDADGGRYDAYDRPVYGEDPSSHDGRLSGPSLDW